jgi:hypothetical protein
VKGATIPGFPKPAESVDFGVPADVRAKLKADYEMLGKRYSRIGGAACFNEMAFLTELLQRDAQTFLIALRAAGLGVKK